MHRLPLIAFVTIVTVAPLAGLNSQAASPAPSSADPSPALKPPASMEEVSIQSGGSRMNGIICLAAGPGAHPVVVFLHGCPGNEKNLDLAQAVRRAGFQAV